MEALIAGLSHSSRCIVARSYKSLSHWLIKESTRVVLAGNDRFYTTEATSYNKDASESLEVKAQKALECPCVADLRNGPCGTQFTESFLCFMKSTTEEKGSDCVHPFIALQDCIKAHPDAFSNDVLEDEEKNDEVVQEQRIIPPSWSKRDS